MVTARGRELYGRMVGKETHEIKRERERKGKLYVGERLGQIKGEVET